MSDTPGDLFLEHQAVIESVIRFVCRQKKLRNDDAEEFAAEVRLHLVESNVLSRFQGRASIKTYLTTVIVNLARDYQVKHWGGRWRPCAAAKAQGTAGIRLDQLVVRDGLTADEAVAVIAREQGPVDVAPLQALAARLPPRTRRQFVGEEMLAAIGDTSEDAERLLVRAEEESRFERVKARLAEIVGRRDPQERLMLLMRYEQGLTTAAVARLLGVDQKRLYRVFDEALVEIRKALEAEGIDAGTVRQMLDGVDA